jgi:hypothetical protein
MQRKLMTGSSAFSGRELIPGARYRSAWRGFRLTGLVDENGDVINLCSQDTFH